MKRRRLVWPALGEEYEREFEEISFLLEGAGIPANWADNAALQLVRLNKQYDEGKIGGKTMSAENQVFKVAVALAKANHERTVKALEDIQRISRENGRLLCMCRGLLNDQQGTCVEHEVNAAMGITEEESEWYLRSICGHLEWINPGEIIILSDMRAGKCQVIPTPVKAFPRK